MSWMCGRMGARQGGLGGCLLANAKAAAAWCLAEMATAVSRCVSFRVGLLWRSPPYFVHTYVPHVAKSGACRQGRAGQRRQCAMSTVTSALSITTAAICMYLPTYLSTRQPRERMEPDAQAARPAEMGSWGNTGAGDGHVVAPETGKPHLRHGISADQHGSL